MVEYCDYVSQVTTPTDDGMLRPDLVVRIPGWKARRDRCEGAARRLPRRVRDVRRCRAAAAVRGSRAAGPRARREAVREGTGASSTRRRTSSSCSFPTSRTCALPTSTTPRPGVRVELERHPRFAEHAHGAPPYSCHDLAAGDDRPERARDLRPRTRALQAAVDDGCALLETRTHARRCRRCLQQDRRFARTPGARAGAPLRAAWNHRHRTAELQPIERQTPAPRPRSSSSRGSRPRSRPLRPAVTT